MTKFGLLNYKYGAYNYITGVNFGDEIQSLAASFFLPRIDTFIDREKIRSFSYNEKVKLIINGWFQHDYREWPPSKDIEPLITSIHIARDKEAFCKRFLTEAKEYLLEHGPIGTRDYATLEILEENDIPAYYSGCLTLTLPKLPYVSKSEYVLLVDVDEKVKQRVIAESKRPVVCISPCIPNSCFFDNPIDKFMFALKYLEIYQSAYAVITSRFHCAMPCLALGTPVLLLKEPIANDVRFIGIDKIVRYSNTENYIRNYDYFDINEVTDNSDEYLSLRNNAISVCESFMGKKHSYDSPIVKWQTKEEYSARMMSAFCGYANNTEINKYQKFLVIQKMQKIKKIFIK